MGAHTSPFLIHITTMPIPGTVYRSLLLLQGLSECSFEARIQSRRRLAQHTWHISLWYSVNGLLPLSLPLHKWPSSLLQYLLGHSASGLTSVALLPHTALQWLFHWLLLNVHNFYFFHFFGGTGLAYL